MKKWSFSQIKLTLCRTVLLLFLTLEYHYELWRSEMTDDWCPYNIHSTPVWLIDSASEDYLWHALQIHSSSSSSSLWHDKAVPCLQLKQYQYYSVGLLSNYDKYYDHQKLVVGSAKRRQQVKQKTQKSTLKGTRNLLQIFVILRLLLLCFSVIFIGILVKCSLNCVKQWA